MVNGRVMILNIKRCNLHRSGRVLNKGTYVIESCVPLRLKVSPRVLIIRGRILNIRGSVLNISRRVLNLSKCVRTKRVDCKPPPLAIVSPQYDSTHHRKCACTRPSGSDTPLYLHRSC